MTGGFVLAAENPANGWRQRGYSDGFAQRDPRPPEESEEAAAYRAGYRRGAEARSKVGA